MAENTFLERMEKAKRLIGEAHDLVEADGEHDVGEKLSDALFGINRVIKEEHTVLEAENKLSAD